MKKVVSLLIAVLTFGVIPVAQANTPIFVANSLEDRTQPPGMGFRYALTSTSVEILDTNPGVLVVKVNFAGDVSNTSFMPYGSSTPMLRVKILTSGGHRDDTGFIWMDAPRDVPYQGSKPIYAPSTYYSDGKSGVSIGRQSLAPCKPTTWMDASGSSNWIRFAIDMNCADIPVTFSVTTQIDADIYSPAAYLDNKYAPAIPMYIDTKGVKRPPKMKDQVVAFVGSVGTQNLDNPTVTTKVTSSLSMPINIISLTPTICLPGAPTASPTLSTLSITVGLLKSGTCTLETWAWGNDTINPSPRATQSFTVNPKVMIKQDLTWDEPFAVMEGDAPFDLYLSSSAGLPVKVTSDSPNVCQFYDSTKPSFVTILSAGTCSISVRVDATDKYFEASGSASFYVDPKPVVKKPPTTSTKPSPNPKTTPSAAPKPPKKKTKTIFGGTGSTTTNETFDTKQGTADTRGVGTKKTTITCKKGGLEKKVTAVKPVCEKGWIKK